MWGTLLARSHSILQAHLSGGNATWSVIRLCGFRDQSQSYKSLPSLLVVDQNVIVASFPGSPGQGRLVVGEHGRIPATQFSSQCGDLNKLRERLSYMPKVEGYY